MKPQKQTTFKPAAYTVTYVKGKPHFKIEIKNTKLTDCVDKQEIQNVLHLSDRTLHTLRKTKRIPFSTIGGKIYYYLPGILSLPEQNALYNNAPQF